jgi:hypothetical protein
MVEAKSRPDAEPLRDLRALAFDRRRFAEAVQT